MIPGLMIVGQRFGNSSSGVPDPSIYSPAFWYSADDLSTLWQDTGATTPVTSDGDPVALWQDKSGNARHFSAGNNATWHTSGGFSWVEFDGSADYLVGSTSMLAFGTTNYFMGARILSGTNDFGTLIGQPQDVTHVNPYYRWSFQSRTSSGFTADFHINGSRVDMSDSGFSAGSDFILGMGLSSMWETASAQQRSLHVRLNKSVAHTGNSGATTITYPNAVAPHMGSQVGGGGDRAKFRLYAMVGFNAAVTSQTWIDDIESYIDSKVP